MTCVAIIPARGGSKRLPRKNILPIMGHPSLYYPVRAALKSQLFEEVIVSTEDQEIRNAALDSGARVMDRSMELAGDSTGVVQVCLDVLERLRNRGVTPESFCCIYPTAVFITEEDLTASYRVFRDSSGAGVVMGVSRFNLTPLQALEDQNGYLVPKWPEYNSIRSQFHPSLVVSNGTLYWADTQRFSNEKTFYVKDLKGYEIPWLRAVDMNEPGDYADAKMLAPLFLSQG